MDNMSILSSLEDSFFLEGLDFFSIVPPLEIVVVFVVVFVIVVIASSLNFSPSLPLTSSVLPLSLLLELSIIFPTISSDVGFKDIIPKVSSINPPSLGPVVEEIIPSESSGSWWTVLSIWMMEWTIGTIMAVEAVLLNHIDRKHVMLMNVKSKDLE